MIGLSLALGYAVVLIGSWLQGHWLIDQQGQAIAGDFVNLWSAGRLALEGQAVAAYDWIAEKQIAIAGVGHDFDDYYPWFYPPTFFFAVAPFALLPYVPAIVAWLVVTFPLYVAAIRHIVGQRAGIFFACGFPAALWNMTATQNGFLTAALLGGTLGFLERRPALAGFFLGLLTYKPHFGLLFPIVLIAGGRWRAIWAAVATTLSLCAASWLVFGTTAWSAFFASMPVASETFFADGRGDWAKLQSLFGLIRAHGGSETLAWSVQWALIVTLMISLCWLWRSRAPFEVKAAALGAGALLATPYIYMYDLAALAVPAAFLLRLMLRDTARPIEILGLSLSGVLILTFPYVKTQVGLAATIILMGLIIGRVIRPANQAVARSIPH